MKRLSRLMAIIMTILTVFTAHAEKPKEAWVLCTPGSKVNVRKNPTRHSDDIAEVYAGDYIELTGKKRGRWYQCDVPCEAGVGWIRGDYLVFDKPTVYLKPVKYVTTHKVFARYSIRGNKCGELKKGTVVSVTVYSEEWCLTSRGYIMTKYLEVTK